MFGRRRHHVFVDDLLYSGHRTLAELDELEAIDGLPWSRPKPEDDNKPLILLSVLGNHRTWRDVKCRCERPIEMVEWYGHDQPLAAWCLKCGRVMPRPLDRRYPLSEADRQAALPTVEVGIVAEAIS